jgi:hypothetical protein
VVLPDAELLLLQPVEAMVPSPSETITSGSGGHCKLPQPAHKKTKISFRIQQKKGFILFAAKTQNALSELNNAFFFVLLLRFSMKLKNILGFRSRFGKNFLNQFENYQTSIFAIIILQEIQ